MALHSTQSLGFAACSASVVDHAGSLSGHQALRTGDAPGESAGHSVLADLLLTMVLASDTMSFLGSFFLASVFLFV